jgi:cysteine synthase B
MNDTHGTVTHFVAAMGTTGILLWESTYLKEQNSDVQIVGAQPSDGSQIQVFENGRRNICLKS